MKLLATDYDGTLHSDNKKIYINISAVNKFRKNGNKFAIVTGRSFESIKKQIEYYNIKYDYLACNNGLIVFDNKNNVLYSSVLSEEDLNYLYKSLNNDYDVKKVDLYNFYSSTNELKDILEIFVIFKNSESAKWYKMYIEKIIPNILCYRIHNKLFIGNKFTKKNAVEFIKNRENIDTNDVYTIGDDINDIDMLEAFNGHKMLYSYPGLWFKRIPITTEVHKLIKKINKR